MPGSVSGAKTTREAAQWSGLRRAATLVAAVGVCFGAAYAVGAVTHDDSAPEAAGPPVRATAAGAATQRSLGLAPAADLPAGVVAVTPARRATTAATAKPRAAAHSSGAAAAATAAAPRTIRVSAPVRRVPVRTQPVRQPVRSAPAPKPTAPASKPAAAAKTITFFDDGG